MSRRGALHTFVPAPPSQLLFAGAEQQRTTRRVPRVPREKVSDVKTGKQTKKEQQEALLDPLPMPDPRRCPGRHRQRRLRTRATPCANVSSP